MGAGEALGVRHRAGLGDDLQAVLVVDQEPEPLTHDGVVVGDDDGRLAAVGASRRARAKSAGVFEVWEVMMTRSVRDAAAGAIRVRPPVWSVVSRSLWKSPASGAATPLGTITTGQAAVAHEPAGDAAEQDGRGRSVAARADDQQV